MGPARFYTTEAIVLKRSNWGEADRLLTVYSREHGKLQLVAKGVRKITSRRASYVEILQHVLLTIHRGRLRDIVTEATSAGETNGSLTNLTQLGYAYYLCEIVDKLTAEGVEQMEIFQLFSQALASLYVEGAEVVWRSTAQEFTNRLLWELGFLPKSRHLTLIQSYDFIEQLSEKKLRTRRLFR